MLDKNQGYREIWLTLQTMLFWKGDKLNLLEYDGPSGSAKGSDKIHNNFNLRDVDTPKRDSNLVVSKPGRSMVRPQTTDGSFNHYQFSLLPMEISLIYLVHLNPGQHVTMTKCWTHEGIKSSLGKIG